tara:strand:- start:369 stop:1046 length:678 start_codon:yes stop_codon:yes gene_type:complete
MHLKISEEFQKKLLEEGEASRKLKLDYRSKLAGIIKEEYAYRERKMFVKEISTCLGIYDQAYQKWRNEAYKQKPEYLLNSLWINYMKKNEFNPPHDHSDALSFVIFLKVPEEILEEQKNYEGNSGGPGSLGFIYGEGNRQAITYQSITPRERDMFIFPAWVKHYVAPFYSDVTRISVSGNIATGVDLNKLREHQKHKFKYADTKAKESAIETDKEINTEEIIKSK